MRKYRKRVNEQLFEKVAKAGYVVGTSLHHEHDGKLILNFVDPALAETHDLKFYMDAFGKDPIGNFMLLWNPRQGDPSHTWWINGGAVEFARMCKERGFYFAFLYLKKGDMTPTLMHQVQQAAGEYFLGMCFGELLLHYYVGPKHWIENPGYWFPDLGHARTMTGAVEELRAVVADYMDWNEAMVGQHVPFWTVSGHGLSHVEHETGFAFPCPELFPLEIGWGLAEARGSARTQGTPFFGAYLAHEWYTFFGHDRLQMDNPLKEKTLRMAFYYAFAAGAQLILTESGPTHTETNFAPQSGEQTNLGFSSEPCKMYRRVQGEFWNYVKDKRPSPRGPDVRLGIVHGRNDGWCGHAFGRAYAQWSQWDAAQKENGWFYRAPEWGWLRLRDTLLPQVTPWFSGTPHGQVDVVSGYASAEDWQRYPALAMLGWNTMDENQYRQLKLYVEQGGTLFTSIPHFTTGDDRSIDYMQEELKLLRDGDYRDLLGYSVEATSSVDRPYYFRQTRGLDGKKLAAEQEMAIPFLGTIHGAPVIECVRCHDIDKSRVTVLAEGETSDGRKLPFLTRTKLGKGVIYCLTLRTWPGEQGLERPVNSLLEQLAISLRGEVYITDDSKPSPAGCVGQGDSRYIYWAVYGDRKTVYLINVDLMRPRTIRLHTPGASRKLTLRPGEFLEMPISRKP